MGMQGLWKGMGHPPQSGKGRCGAGGRHGAAGAFVVGRRDCSCLRISLFLMK